MRSLDFLSILNNLLLKTYSPIQTDVNLQCDLDILKNSIFRHGNSMFFPQELEHISLSPVLRGKNLSKNTLVNIKSKNWIP